MGHGRLECWAWPRWGLVYLSYPDSVPTRRFGWQGWAWPLLGTAPRAQQGIASGVPLPARNFGMVLGIGLAGAVFTTRLAQNRPDALDLGIDQGFLAAAIVALLGILSSAIKDESNLQARH